MDLVCFRKFQELFVGEVITSREAGLRCWGAQAGINHGQSLLAIESERAPAIGETRRRNYKALADSVKGLPGIALLFPSLPDDCDPYVLPLRVESGAERVSRALLRVGVPALQWPELPPEVLGQSGHEMAKSLFTRALLLPVHQSLRPKQIEMMGRCLKETVERFA